MQAEKTSFLFGANAPFSREITLLLYLFDAIFTLALALGGASRGTGIFRRNLDGRE